MSRSYRIITLQAKDIYNAIATGRDGGINVRDKNGDIKLRMFSNALYWSLDSDRLMKAHRTFYKNRRFYFRDETGFLYTQSVINVDFDYSYKEFNRKRLYKEDGQWDDVYIRAGFEVPQSNEMTGCTLMQDGKLIAIKTDVTVPEGERLSQEELGRCFTLVDDHYEVTNISTIMSKAELRSYLYENGFDCDGIHYVRYKRSSGSSRLGKCLFVDENLKDAMTRYDRCYLSVEEGAEIDLPAYEAYIALTMSSIVGTIEIRPDQILVVDDYQSVFEDEVAAVRECQGTLTAQKEKTTITNSIWDGQSLLDSSMFEGEYSGKGMLLLRNRFFKTCAFNTNIQKFFADYGITDVEQLNGRTIAQSVEDIKLITTPSSIKYLKFGPLSNWLRAVGSTYGVVKFEKPPHFFGGKLVQTSYQLLNTLHLQKEDVDKLLQTSFDYIEAIRSDPSVMRYELKINSSPDIFNHQMHRLIGDDDTEIKLPTLPSQSEVVFSLLAVNDRIQNTKLYNNFLNDITRSKYKELRKGHLLVNGNYSTLFGNGPEMLFQSIGGFDGGSFIGVGNIISKRFKPMETILCARSPHITMGNLLLRMNTTSDFVDDYFNLTNEIVCINSIKENSLQALNGADFDSDTMLLTNNPILLKAAMLHEGKFSVPTCLVECSKRHRHYTTSDLSDLDVNTSENHIGEIVNLSQQLNSLLWDKVNQGESIEECQELYLDICKLAVLSGIEIDKAKHEYTIDSANEMSILRKKYQKKVDGKRIKPSFFKTITKDNGYELSPNIQYVKHKTTMDYIQTRVNSYVCKRGKKKDDVIPLYGIINKPANDGISSNYLYRDRALDAIRQLRADITNENLRYEKCSRNGESTPHYIELAKYYKEAYEKFSESVRSPYILYLVLKKAEEMQYCEKSAIMKALYYACYPLLKEMIELSAEPIRKLTEDANGSISYYGIGFSMI